MANYTKMFTIAFERNNLVVDYSMIEFFRRVELLMDTEREKVVRKINGKVLRVHKYYWNDMNDDFVVIPYGKLKETNKPLGMDQASQQLVDIDADMFDVNSLAYHSRFKVALLTTNQSGPSEDDIENYLNSFLDPTSIYKVRLRPIKHSMGIEKIRTATQARNLTVVLDLGRPLNDFFAQEVNVETGVNGFLRGLMNYSKESLDSKTFSITLGLGHKKTDTLDLTTLIDLLDSINLDSSCIKEIYVNYKDQASTKIDTAKLKDSQTIIKIPFEIKGTRIASEFLKHNLHEKLQTERNKYYIHVQQYFQGAIPADGEYTFITDWNEGPVV